MQVSISSAVLLSATANLSGLHGPSTVTATTFHNRLSDGSGISGFLVYDPVTQSPSMGRGFAVHPYCYVVVKSNRGYLHKMSDYEKERLRSSDRQVGGKHL